MCPVRSLTCIQAASETETSYTFIICKMAEKSSLCEIGRGNGPTALQVSGRSVGRGVGRGVLRRRPLKELEEEGSGGEEEYCGDGYARDDVGGGVFARGAALIGGAGE